MSETQAMSVPMDQHPALLASVRAIRTKLNLPYTEHVYGKSLSELAGVSFEPLAGITVTFLPTLLDHVDVESQNSNLIFMGHYVEYLTGHRRTVGAVVSLADGYVPLKVEAKALNASLLRSLEYHLNECGYTTQSNAPDGLRLITVKQIGHALLDLLCDPIRAFGDWEVQEDKVTIDVVGEHIQLQVDATYYIARSDTLALKSMELGVHLLRHIRGHSRTPYGNLIHSSVMGPLAEVGGQNIWVESGYEFPANLYVSHEDVLTNPVSKKTNPDRSTTTSYHHRYDKVFQVHEIEQTQFGHLNPYVTGELNGTVLTLLVPLDLTSPPEFGKFVVDDPSQWSYLNVTGVVETLEEVTNDSHPRRASLRPVGMYRKDEVDYAYLTTPEFARLKISLARFLESRAQRAADEVRNTPAQKVLQPMVGNVRESAIDVVAEPVAEERLLPWTFIDRLRMAWRAFNAPDPLTKE